VGGRSSPNRLGLICESDFLLERYDVRLDIYGVYSHLVVCWQQAKADAATKECATGQPFMTITLPVARFLKLARFQAALVMKPFTIAYSRTIAAIRANAAG
jgi:hypothetical protein